MQPVILTAEQAESIREMLRQTGPEPLDDVGE